MKAIKVIFRYSIYLLIGLVLAMVVIPFVFKDKLVEGIRMAANENIEAAVDFSDIDLSLFRAFPDVSVRIMDLSIDGVDDFVGTPLLSTDYIDLGIYLPSLWSSDGVYRVNNVTAKAPTLNVLVLKNGQANYDIIPPSEEETNITFAIQLSDYQIIDGNIQYTDQQNNTDATINNLNHRGSGDMTETIYNLATNTTIGSTTVSYDGTTYLRKAAASLDAILEVDLGNNRYTLKDNSLWVNSLQLNADGSLQLLDNGSMKIDLDLNAPNTDFADVYSLIPYAYTKDYGDIESRGSGRFNASLKGIYQSEPARYPAIDMQMTLQDGYILYPDLPTAISDIQLQARVQSTKANMSDIDIDISKLHMDLDGQSIDARAHITEPLGNTAVDMAAKGNIDLSKLAQAMPLEGVQELSGLIDADVVVKGDQKAINANDFRGAVVSGQASIANIVYKGVDQPRIAVSSAEAVFDTKKVTIDLGKTNLGSSDIAGTIVIDNILDYIVQDEELSLSADLKSDNMDANEWLSEEVVDTSTTETTGIDLASYKADIKYAAKTLKYDEYLFTDVTVNGQLADDKLSIQQSRLNTINSDLAMSGQVVNLTNYINETGPLGGDLTLTSKQLKLEDFMTSTADPSADLEAGVVPVPADIDINLTTLIGQLLYDDLSIKNLNGQVRVADQIAEITNATADGLGGKMQLTGSYSTVTDEEPAFTMKYDLSKINFGETFRSVTTAKAFAPIIEYIDGFFNSTIVMDGILTDDMMPDLSSLNASGFIETLDSRIKGFEPLENIGNKLSIDNLKNLALENTKNWIEINNGRLELKPQEVTYEGIDMVISGEHGLATDMQYLALMHVPRSLLSKGSVGTAANTGLSFLEEKAGNLGLDISTGDYIDLQVALGGTITKPTISIKPVGSSNGKDLKGAIKSAAEDRAKAEIETVKDSVKTAVKKAEQKTRDSVNVVVETAKDSVNKIIDKEVEKAEEKVKEVVTEKVSEVVGDSLAAELDKKAEEILGEKGKEEVDKIKDKIKDFNPFGKRKKKDK